MSDQTIGGSIPGLALQWKSPLDLVTALPNILRLTGWGEFLPHCCSERWLFLIICFDAHIVQDLASRTIWPLMPCVLRCVPRAVSLALSRSLFRLPCSFPALALETEHCLESCSSEWVVMLRKNHVASLVSVFASRQSESKHLSVTCRLSICLSSFKPSAVHHLSTYLPPVNLSSLSHLSTCHLSIIYFGSSYHLSVNYFYLRLLSMSPLSPSSIFCLSFLSIYLPSITIV